MTLNLRTLFFGAAADGQRQRTRTVNSHRRGGQRQRTRTVNSHRRGGRRRFTTRIKGLAGRLRSRYSRELYARTTAARELKNLTN